MAFYLSFNSSPLLPFFPSHKQLQLNGASNFAVPSLRPTRVSFRTISSLGTSKYTITRTSYDSSNPIRVACGKLPQLSCFRSGRAYCSRTLTGYWVGPDTEDGCGFIEALVDEII